jgi:ribosomal protein L10
MRRSGTLNERIVSELSESINNKRTFLLVKYNNFIERVFDSRLNAHFKYKHKRRTKK